MSQNSTGEIVLLTGSSGCLGHQTLRLLLSHDDLVQEIRCLDICEPNDLMKREIELEQELVERKLGFRKRVRLIKGDIRDINLIEQALSDGVSCVIHCAALIDIWRPLDEQDGDKLESVNVHGTEQLLKACIRFGVHKFVHVSSFETFVSYHTIYYATESTIPDPKHLLFGPSAETKKEAENKVRQYSNNKLKRINTTEKDDNQGEKQRRDTLCAVIVRFTPIYGEHDKHFVTKLLQITKFFSNKLQRFTNVWIRQQPIYVGNAAWSLIKAKQRMDKDESISGEEFHITDDTTIGDPFDFVEPFVKCKGMQVTESTCAAWPVWFLIVLFTFMRKFLISLDIFGLFTTRKRTRLDEAIERDNKHNLEDESLQTNVPVATRWYHLITSQTFYFMCNSLFLNRTKASLRLDYEPLFTPDEAMKRSLDWYKNHLKL